MLQFEIQFKNTPALLCQLHNTELATSYYHLLKQQYLDDPCPIFRDPQRYENIPKEHDDLLHELHFALHAIEAGSQRSTWLQVEWYNDLGFPISADEYPGKTTLDFGDIRLQNPYVGHHPQFIYQQRDSANISQTCRFHDLCKPGINLVIEQGEHIPIDWPDYLSFFRRYANEFLVQHSEEKLCKFTGHPVVGRIVNLKDFRTVLAEPYLEFDSLVF